VVRGRPASDRRFVPTAAYGAVLFVVLVIVALLPFALTSVAGDLTEQSARVFELDAPPAGDQDIRSDVHLQVIGLNE
jgi:hypothetical protein